MNPDENKTNRNDNIVVPSSNLHILLNPLIELTHNKVIPDPNLIRQISYDLQCNRMRTALYSVFCDIKRQITPQMTQKPGLDQSLLEQQQRLDEMLINENIIANSTMLVSRTGQHPPPKTEEHARQLGRLRAHYNGQMFCCDGARYELNARALTTLQEHNAIRPIAQEDVDALMGNLSNKFARCRVELKLSTCQTAMALRSKQDHCFKKRRNFSKAAVALLNEYFAAHMDHPYPSEDVKHELSTRTGLSVAQVSNWFGNKRIRYRAKLKAHKEAQDAMLEKENINVWQGNGVTSMGNGFVSTIL